MDAFNDPTPPGHRDTTVTLATFLDRFEMVETEANGYVVLCPSHSDTKPSLRVGYNAPERKIALKCRAGCDTKAVVEALGLRMSDLFNVRPGDLDDVRSAGRVPDAPAVGDLAALAGYLGRAATVDDLGPAKEYAWRRFGITSDRFEEMGLGYDDGTVPAGKLGLSRTAYHDTHRLVVPFNDFDGNPQYLQARAIGAVDGVRAKWSGPVNPEGVAWAKWGFFQGGNGWTEVIVTEGPGDCLTAAALGYDVVQVRGAGLGTNAGLLDALGEGLRGRRIVVAGDADAAGAKFTRDVAGALSDRGLDVHRLTIPVDGGDDITKWREMAGAAFDKAFIKAVQDAPRYGSDEITVEEIAQDVSRLFSDVYNAKTLLSVMQEQGGDVKFTDQAGYYIYRPEVGVWTPDEQEWVRSQAQTVAGRVQRAVLNQMQAMDLRVAGIDDKEMRDKTGTLLDKMRAKARSGSLVSYVMSTRGIDSMMRELRALPGVSVRLDIFDKDKDKLAARNGIIDLETGNLIPFSEHTRNMMVTRRVDMDYRPHARNPRWERFLREIFEEYPDLPAYMQRLIGYGITGRTSEQCFGILFGTGANGKSVFTDTLANLFDGIAATAAFETFEAGVGNNVRPDIARLHSARLVLTEEGKQGAPMAEATLKLISGSGKVTTRFLYQKEFEYRPEFLLLMASNYRPSFKGADEGLWRRVRLIPFTRYFSPAARDKYLPQKFAGERVPASSWRDDDDMGDGPEGIFAWAVRGAVEWYARGLQDPPVVTVATDDYRKSSDALGPFYAEYLTVEPEGRVAGKDVWADYQKWCDEEGLAPKDRWKRATFWSALEERGAVKSVPHGTVSFKGIRRRRPSDPHPYSDETPAEQPAHPDHLPASPLGDDVPPLGDADVPPLESFMG